MGKTTLTWSANSLGPLHFCRQIQFADNLFCHHNFFISQSSKSSCFQDTTREGIWTSSPCIKHKWVYERCARPCEWAFGIQTNPFKLTLICLHHHFTSERSFSIRSLTFTSSPWKIVWRHTLNKFQFFWLQIVVSKKEPVGKVIATQLTLTVLSKISNNYGRSP